MLGEIKDKLDAMEKRDIRIETKLDGLQRELNSVKVENEQLKKENEHLKERSAHHERILERMSREIKKRNIIIHGIEDQKEESNLQLKEKVRAMLRDMRIEVEMEKEVVEVRRLGKHQKERPRPIQVEFGKWEKKMEILKGTKNLKGRNIYIEEEYSKETQDIRKQLFKHRDKIRSQGHHAIMRYNKLIINGDEYNLEQLKDLEKDPETEKEVSRGIGREPEGDGEEGETSKGKERAGGRKISERSPEEDLQERLRKKTKTSKNTGTTPKNSKRN